MTSVDAGTLTPKQALPFMMPVGLGEEWMAIAFVRDVDMSEWHNMAGRRDACRHVASPGSRKLQPGGACGRDDWDGRRCGLVPVFGPGN